MFEMYVTGIGARSITEMEQVPENVREAGSLLTWHEFSLYTTPFSKIISEAAFDGIGSGDAFRRMYVLDAVILNTDRHYGNFGVPFDTDTLGVLGMAPVFDHNRSLSPEPDNDQLADPAWHLRHCKPRLSQDFLRNARGLLTEEIRRDLTDLTDFTFHQHPRIHAEQERMDVLSRIVQERVRLILSE